jgi:hypothetical protein
MTKFNLYQRKASRMKEMGTPDKASLLKIGLLQRFTSKFRTDKDFHLFLVPTFRRHRHRYQHSIFNIYLRTSIISRKLRDPGAVQGRSGL